VSVPAKVRNPDNLPQVTSVDLPLANLASQSRFNAICNRKSRQQRKMNEFGSMRELTIKATRPSRYGGFFFRVPRCEKNSTRRCFQDIEALRALIGKASSETVCLKLFLLLSDTYKTFHGIPPFLTVQTASKPVRAPADTREHVATCTLTEGDGQRFFQYLNNISFAYAFMFWPTRMNKRCHRRTMFKQRSVAMPAFPALFQPRLPGFCRANRARIEATLVHF